MPPQAEQTAQEHPQIPIQEGRTTTFNPIHPERGELEPIEETAESIQGSADEFGRHLQADADLAFNTTLSHLSTSGDTAITWNTITEMDQRRREIQAANARESDSQYDPLKEGIYPGGDLYKKIYS